MRQGQCLFSHLSTKSLLPEALRAACPIPYLTDYCRSPGRRAAEPCSMIFTRYKSGLPSVKAKWEQWRPRAPRSYCVNTDQGTESSYDITYMWNLKYGTGTSLVAQWLRIRLPMQGTGVRALVWEDPTCRGATKPMHHNY